MNQRTLIYFLKVFEHNSIKKAAKELTISPQGLSKTLIGFENEIGIPLFNRINNKMIPTDYAYKVKAHAEKIIDEFSYIKYGINTSGNEKNVLNIVTTYGVIQYLSADFIKDFYKEYTNIQLNIIELTDFPAIERLKTSRVELAILSSPLNTVDFTGEFLFSSKHCVIVNNNNPLSNKKSISYEDLKNEPLAVKGREHIFYNTNISRFLEQGINPNIYIETSNDKLIHDLAEKNMAVGISLDYIAFNDIRKNTTILPLSDNNSVRSLYITQRKNAVLSNDAENFKNFILNWIKRNNKIEYIWPKLNE